SLTARRPRKSGVLMARKTMDGDTTASSLNTAVSPSLSMPQALVILGFLTAALVMRLAAHASLQDTVVLLSTAGAVSVIVVLAAGQHHNQGPLRLLRRLLNAALMPGSGS
ncbi:hypothetical protein, partial [Streptomyces mirabilis]|uniref:hypothetical protein n=1 Tax=Streptomyces mirabilis TaxID=68239 RepID=UPI0036D1D5A8